MKGEVTLHVLVVNYTNNKHVTFKKGQCTGDMEPSIDNMPQASVNRIITQKMMHEQVQQDTFTLPLHNISQD